jgi:hydroxymethylbilane synthase
LGGSCQTPLAAHAVVETDQLFLRASLALPDGSRVLYSQARGSLTAAQQLGEQVVRDLHTQGAQGILDDLSSYTV